MKAKNPPPGGGSHLGDPEKDLTKDQLAKIAAIALEYNYAEIALERILFHSLNIIGNLWVDTVKRISSIEAKIDLSKLSVAYSSHILIDVGHKELAFDEEYGRSIGAFSVCKKYRDLIIHSQIYNSKPTIGKKFGYKGEQSAEHVVMTITALKRMHAEIKLVRKELETVEEICAFVRPTVVSRSYGAMSPTIPPSPKALECLGQLRAHQKQRQSLGPYPQLPKSTQVEQE